MMAAISSDDGDEGWTAELLELFLHGRFLGVWTYFERFRFTNFMS